MLGLVDRFAYVGPRVSNVRARTIAVGRKFGVGGQAAKLNLVPPAPCSHNGAQRRVAGPWRGGEESKFCNINVGHPSIVSPSTGWRRIDRL